MRHFNLRELQISVPVCVCVCVTLGDVLCVEGDMDENGYYCASFGGVSGLVPANFVQEAEVSDFTIRNRLFNQVRTTHKHSMNHAVLKL